MAGQCPLWVNNPDVDQKETHQWLRRSGLKAETEKFFLSAQYQNQLTRHYQAKVTKNGADPRCCICTQYEETMDHLTFWCPTLLPNEYLNRHNRVAQYLHWKICKHYRIQTNKLDITVKKNIEKTSKLVSLKIPANKNV